LGGFDIFPELSNFYCPLAKPGVYLKEIIELVTIGPRKSIYEETFRIISRE
jgi:hypothetical protein